MAILTGASENTHALLANTGQLRESLTAFSYERSSDPTQAGELAQS